MHTQSMQGFFFCVLKRSSSTAGNPYASTLNDVSPPHAAPPNNRATEATAGFTGAPLKEMFFSFFFFFLFPIHCSVDYVFWPVTLVPVPQVAYDMFHCIPGDTLVVL